MASADKQGKNGGQKFPFMGSVRPLYSECGIRLIPRPDNWEKVEWVVVTHVKKAEKKKSFSRRKWGRSPFNRRARQLGKKEGRVRPRSLWLKETKNLPTERKRGGSKNPSIDI